MPSLRELWQAFPARVEAEVRGYGYRDFAFTLNTEAREFPFPISVTDRVGNGWGARDYPMGPFIGNGVTSAGQSGLRRYRYGTGGRVVVDNVPSAVPSEFRRSLRYTNRTTADRSVMERFGLADLVPNGHSIAIPAVSFNGNVIGYAAPTSLPEDMNRCCSCREVNTHSCCRGGYRSYQVNCTICDLPRGVNPRNTCVCNAADPMSTDGARCEHNWEAVRVDNYTSPAPNGFRSLSAEDGRPLWSSSPSAEVPYYLGIEWEVSGDAESIGTGILATMTGSEWINSNGHMPLIVKSDSSVEGEEICFSPMSPAAALAFPWDTMAGELNRSYDEPDGHGVHVHISESAFTSDDAFRRWVDLVNIHARPMAQHIARRNSDEWGRFNGRRVVDTTRPASENGRYSAINASTHHGTHEVRIFRSADTGDEMRAAIAFVAASVDYIRDGGTHDDMVEFRSWVTTSLAYVPHLENWFPAGFGIASVVEEDPVTASNNPWAAASVTTSNGGGASGSFRIADTWW